MEDDLGKQLQKLQTALVELEKASKKALGFISTVDYRGIPFNVSRRFVIADLSPLAFFHLVEYIEGDDVGPAIVRLHERLVPLLACRHDWVVLRRADDEPMRTIVKGTNRKRQGEGPYICKFCTAYALGPSLPAVGRSLA